MNINVLVLNVPHDFRDPAPKRPAAAFNEGIDEVLELVPLNEGWGARPEVHAGHAKAHPANRQAGHQATHRAGERAYAARYAPKASEGQSYGRPLPSALSYNQNGKVQYSCEQKGLRINVTA